MHTHAHRRVTEGMARPTHTHTHTHTHGSQRAWLGLAACRGPKPCSPSHRLSVPWYRPAEHNCAAPGTAGGWVEGGGSKQTPQLSLRPSMSLGAPVRPRFKQPSPPDDPGPHLDGSLFPFHRLQGAWQGSPRTSSGPGVLRWDLSQWQGRRQLRESHQRPISKMQWKTKALELLTGQSLHS